MTRNATSAVDKFLAQQTGDELDEIARRSIDAFRLLGGLRRNAYDRGDSGGFEHCAMGQNAALTAFAYVNTRKHYPFAADVHEAMEESTRLVAGDSNKTAIAVDCLSTAEAIYDNYAHVLTPVSKVEGVSSVLILRGDHARASFAGLHIANDR